MPVFSPRDMQALHGAYATLQGRLDATVDAYVSFPYKTPRGHEFATRGFLRRLNTMHHCIERVFKLIPPRAGAKARRPHFARWGGLSSVFVNTFGALDNL